METKNNLQIVLELLWSSANSWEMHIGQVGFCRQWYIPFGVTNCKSVSTHAADTAYHFQSIRIFPVHHGYIVLIICTAATELYICAIFESKLLCFVLIYCAFWFKVLFVLKLEFWPLCQNLSQISKCSSNTSKVEAKI